MSYENNAAKVMVSFRYVPELDWYLVVEQNEDPQLKPLQEIFWVNITASAVILLKDCSVERATELARKLVDRIAQPQTATALGITRLTVSIGVAEYQADETLSDFLVRADRALYRAKEAGRNRVEVETVAK